MRASDILVEAVLPPQLYAPHPRSEQYPKPVREAMNHKPRAQVWTSTARQTPRGWTSEWVQWCQNEMPGWVGTRGFLFDVSNSARILTIRSDRDAARIARRYGAEINNDADLFMLMPWAAIQADYDAIRYQPRGHDFFMGLWDVESTAWFDTAFLQNRRAVDLAPPQN